MTTKEHIDALPSCDTHDGPCDVKEALQWLVESADDYPSRSYVPPLTPMANDQKPRSFLAFTMRVRRKKLLGTGTKPGRIDWTDGQSIATIDAPDADSVSSAFFAPKNAGYFLVTSGKDRGVLDLFLESFGPGLCEMGYTLEPCMSGSRISFIVVRKGKRSWTVVYAETISGVPVSTLLDYARGAGQQSVTERSGGCQSLYDAIAAYQSFLMGNFGVAVNHTVGMTALHCARRDLPPEYKQWRPVPLLVSMERYGRGYRGGMAHAVRHKGPATRIDVIRQYAHALTTPLPYRVAFGRYISPEVTPHGVFVCQVRLTSRVPYLLSIWHGLGFESRTVGAGDYVSVLHTSEFPGLESAGASISPYYGFVFTHTFTLARYIERLQHLLDTEGYDSPVSRMCKPLGNYVYGKFGQNPMRKDLMFSTTDPRGEWVPYVDENLKEWPLIWERTVRKYTASQHVEIAATVTGAARSQTVQMWKMLEDAGAVVVRCHTDSLTFTVKPGADLSGIEAMLSESRIGSWRVERLDTETVIVGVNAYVDESGAHIAGVSDPTWEMIERVYDGHVLHVVQQENAPMRGFARGQREVTRRYGG